MQLATFSNSDKGQYLDALCNAFGFILRDESPRASNILFKYHNPITPPLIVPPRHLLKASAAVSVEGDSILRFGALEGTVIANGKRVVYDPQDLECPEHFRANGSRAEELAVVCNLSEGKLLTRQSSPEAVALSLLAEGGTSVAVIKLGAGGVLVAEPGGKFSHVPAHRTESVFSIGSGDIFSATFAYFWATQRSSAVEAAEQASRFTAFYCGNQMIPSSKETVDQFVQSLPASNAPGDMARTPRVYLAGPFFTMGQVWVIELAKDAIESLGMEVFSPYHDVGIGAAEDVVSKDVEELEKADFVYAVVDGLDAGTLFEIGYAVKRGIPVIAYQQNEGEEAMKMLVGTGVDVVRDFATSIYKLSWLK